MKKYRITFSVPGLTGKNVRTVTIKDQCLEDTWSHVVILGEVYDLNVWYGGGPIQATVYPTSITEEGYYTTDTSSPIPVLLHSVTELRLFGFMSTELNLKKIRGGMSQNQITLELTIIVKYDLNGATVEEMKLHLSRIVDHAMGGGLLTGDTAAEVSSIEEQIEEIGV